MDTITVLYTPDSRDNQRVISFFLQEPYLLKDNSRRKHIVLCACIFLKNQYPILKTNAETSDHTLVPSGPAPHR